MSDAYDKILARIKKGEAYLDNIDIPYDERKHWINEYQKLVIELNRFKISAVQMRINPKAK